MAFALRQLLCSTCAVLLVGCAGTDVLDPVHRGPFFIPRNHAGDPSLGGIRRVVVLPVYGGTVAAPEAVAALDPVLVEALQGVNRFEVVTLSREECLRRFRAPELSSASALPHGLLGQLKQEFAVDAVLFADITVFSPYRPLAIGFRAKLASIDGTRLIWTFDDVFAADNPSVANAARRHFLTGDRGGVPADLSSGVLQSPARFAGYAAATMFATLPPVVLPPKPEKPAAQR
jgi:hypothetical protein